MSQVVSRRCDRDIREGRKWRKCLRPVPNDIPTVFSVDHDAYASDLCDQCKLHLLEALAPFIKIADTSYTQIGPAVRKALLMSGGELTTERDIRAWAMDNGYEVAPRGRISKELRAAHEEAHRALH